MENSLLREWAASSGPPRRPHSQRTAHARAQAAQNCMQGEQPIPIQKKNYRLTLSIPPGPLLVPLRVAWVVLRLVARRAGALCTALAGALHARTANRGSPITMGSGASSTAAAAPAKDSKKPVQLLPTHNVQVPSKCARLYFGLSWSAKANIDIDASAVCLAGAQVADIISFQKLRDATPASIVHTGDVLTSGTARARRIWTDDVQPEAMEKRGVDNIFLVVNVYTQGRTFCDVNSAYARLVHADSDQELARFNLKGCRGDALVFAKLYKHGNKWNWMGLGQQGSGRTAAEVAKALALRMVPPAAVPVQAAAPPPTIVQVLVQPGIPGQSIQVRAPDGRVLSVLVPPTSIPGSVILVNTAPPPQHGVQAKGARGASSQGHQERPPRRHGGAGPPPAPRRRLLSSPRPTWSCRIWASGPRAS